MVPRTAVMMTLGVVCATALGGCGSGSDAVNEGGSEHLASTQQERPKPAPVGWVMAKSPAVTAGGMVYQAEQAARSGVSFQTKHPRYTGTGYLDYAYSSATGAYIEWTVTAATAGNKTLTFRYANGSTRNRPLAISVNGTTVNSALPFKPTGAWNAWGTTSVTAKLPAGTHIKIRATTIGSNGANIDSLTIPTRTPNTPGKRHTARPTPPPTASASTHSNDASPEGQVLALINRARAAQGAPPLTRTADLDTRAAKHNQIMAGSCGLNHDCPNDPGLPYGWSGQNIGAGGPVGSTTKNTTDMALGLTQSMLNEKPPNDGHRWNILTTRYRYIGIDVLRDARGKVWLTQNFFSPP